jgi:glycine cleavage system aminomethyltransferase T
MWQARPKGGGGPMVESWLVQGFVLLVLRYGVGGADGWDLFLPASKSNGVAATLEAAAAFLAPVGGGGS